MTTKTSRRFALEYGLVFLGVAAIGAASYLGLAVYFATMPQSYAPSPTLMGVVVASKLAVLFGAPIALVLFAIHALVSLIRRARR
jgi:hypothetical protein